MLISCLKWICFDVWDWHVSRPSASQNKLFHGEVMSTPPHVLPLLFRKPGALVKHWHMAGSAQAGDAVVIGLDVSALAMHRPIRMSRAHRAIADAAVLARQGSAGFQNSF